MAHEELDLNYSREWSREQARLEPDSGSISVGGLAHRVIHRHVLPIVMDKLNGLTPEQIHESYPHLSLAQIYSALAYYYDHKEELDAQIGAESNAVEAMRLRAIATGVQPTRAELEARRKRGHLEIP